VIFSYLLVFDAPVRGCPSDYYLPIWFEKTRMTSLPDDGKKSDDICLPVLTECTNVTDRHTHTHRQRDGHRMTAKAALDASIARQKSGRTPLCGHNHFIRFL